MSFPAIRAAFQLLERPDLTSSQRLVLLILANRCNSETGQCNPGVGKLARDTGLGERTVQQAIRGLEAKEILFTEHSDGGRNKTNFYSLNPAAVAPFNTNKPRNGRTVSEHKPRRKRQETPQKTAINPAAAAPESYIEPVKNQKSVLHTPTRSEEENREGHARIATMREILGSMPIARDKAKT